MSFGSRPHTLLGKRPKSAPATKPHPGTGRVGPEAPPRLEDLHTRAGVVPDRAVQPPLELFRHPSSSAPSCSLFRKLNARRPSSLELSKPRTLSLPDRLHALPHTVQRPTAALCSTGPRPKYERKKVRILFLCRQRCRHFPHSFLRLDSNRFVRLTPVLAYCKPAFPLAFQKSVPCTLLVRRTD